MVAQSLKPEYKQTEIGAIPEDWEVCELKDAVDFLDGQRRPVKSTDRAKVRGIYPYYGASGIIDYVDDYLFDDELILLGEDGENILIRNLPLAFQVKGKVWVNNHAHVLKPKLSFDIKFLTEYLESLDYSLLNSGTAQPKLNKQACMKIKIAKPLKHEQAAIARVLSDTDTLIESLDKLIIKKKNIKQGAMQQLLTGKKRLPGFKGEWKKKRLGDVLSYEQPVNYIVRNSEYDDAYTTPVLTANKAFVLGYTNETDGIFEEVPVIIFDDFTLDSKYVTFPFKVKSSAIKILKTRDEKSNLNFIFGLMQLIKFPLGDHKRYYISEYQNLEIMFPDSEEQSAIAKVLSDMDSEIEELEQKRDKYKMIKAGMMQQLLTGRIRLSCRT